MQNKMWIFILQFAECIILTRFCKNLANWRMLSKSFILYFPECIGHSHRYVICPDITQDKNSIFTKSHAVGTGSMYYNKIWRYMQEPRNTSKKNEACQVVILNMLANWPNMVHELLGDSTITIDKDTCYLLASQESDPLAVWFGAPFSIVNIINNVQENLFTLLCPLKPIATWPIWFPGWWWREPRMHSDLTCICCKICEKIKESKEKIILCIWSE